MPKTKTEDTSKPNQHLVSVFLGRDDLFPVHTVHTGAPRELTEHLAALFTQLSTTFMEAMKRRGIHIGHVEIPWYPEKSFRDANEKAMKVTVLRAVIELDKSAKGKVGSSSSRRSHS